MDRRSTERQESKSAEPINKGLSAPLVNWWSRKARYFVLSIHYPCNIGTIGGPTQSSHHRLNSASTPNRSSNPSTACLCREVPSRRHLEFRFACKQPTIQHSPRQSIGSATTGDSTSSHKQRSAGRLSGADENQRWFRCGRGRPGNQRRNTETLAQTARLLGRQVSQRRVRRS
jgi:hypothetical protein